MTPGPDNSSGQIVHTSLDGTPDDASVGRWQGRLSISVTLATAIGLLVAVAALSVPVVVLIVTALALGKALMGTGMADAIAMNFVALVSALPVAVILSAFLLLMILMTVVRFNFGCGSAVAFGAMKLIVHSRSGFSGWVCR